jgi:hypothetical protein
MNETDQTDRMSALTRRSRAQRDAATARGRGLPRLGGVDPMGPAQLALVPDQVRAASEAHREALERHAAVRDQAQRARADVDTAVAADAAGARAAVEAGELPPAATATEFAELAERAARAIEPAETLARQTQAAFVTALVENIDAARSEVESKRRAASADAVRHTDALEAALDEITRLDLLLSQLAVDGLAGRNPMFTPTPRRLPPSPPAIASIRARLGESVEYGRASW